MKLVKIIIGLAAGVYAALQVRQLTQVLETSTGSAYNSGRLAGCIAGICLGAALCIYLLVSAFKRPESSS